MKPRQRKPAKRKASKKPPRVAIATGSRRRWPAMVALANSVFRVKRAGRMELEYPLLFGAANLRNWRIATARGKVVSAAGLLPRAILLGGRRVKVGNLGSVCTDPAWRGRGIALSEIRELEARALSLGIRIIFISGDGHLYERFGAPRAGRFPIIEVPRGRDVDPAVSVSPLGEQDLARAQAMYGEESTRFVRSMRQLRALFRRGHVCDRPGAAFLIEEDGAPAAYAALALRMAGKSYDRVIVEEYAGSRRAFWRAMPLIADQLAPPEEPVFVRGRADDGELWGLAETDGAAIVLEEFPGTLKVIDPAGLLRDLSGRRLRRWPPRATGPLPADDDTAGWTRLFFGAVDDPVDPVEIEGLSLPVPLVSYGFDYE